LRPSDIHGIGVFAVRDISEGTNLFPECTSPAYYKINLSRLTKLNKNVIKMMEDFFVFEKGYFFVPKSLNSIDISFYLNHSITPNCHFKPDEDIFITLEPILEGDEITIDYAEL